jgi:hypothetical protein
MVIHIGIILAAGRSPSVPQPMPACNRMPAVLSLRDHFLRSDSSWRNGTVRRAKSPALTALTAPTPENLAISALREPRKAPIASAQTCGSRRLARLLRYERIILRGVLAVQSHEAEGPARP